MATVNFPNENVTRKMDELIFDAPPLFRKAQNNEIPERGGGTEFTLFN